MDEIEQLRAEVSALREAVRALTDRLDMCEGVNSALSAMAFHRAFHALANDAAFREENLTPIKAFEAAMTNAVLEELARIAALQDDAINYAFLRGLNGVAHGLRQAEHQAKSRKLDRR